MAGIYDRVQVFLVEGREKWELSLISLRMALIKRIL